ncbi:hypothetical protein BpHYR1_036271 [Brachionus plicatilis]|uniref:Uncharacterized protein n=1 Tax=Brachionus plicatilis TaxID=10195 RepID=A0A3M7PIA7_BRAPC|nr:hypothetical protein BpHYR1_036271 [Brachionus plicatilis]
MFGFFFRFFFENFYNEWKKYKNKDKQSPLITVLNFDSVRLAFFEPALNSPKNLHQKRVLLP